MKNYSIFCKIRLLAVMFLFLYVMFMLYKVGGMFATVFCSLYEA